MLAQRQTHADRIPIGLPIVDGPEATLIVPLEKKIVPIVMAGSAQEKPVERVGSLLSVLGPVFGNRFRSMRHDMNLYSSGGK